MAPKVSAIMLGVQDLARARKFYAEGLGAVLKQDFPGFVSLDLGEGSSSLALYEWAAAASDAGVSPEGSGFRGVSFHYIAGSSGEVDEVITKAEAAGGSVADERRRPRGSSAGGGADHAAVPVPLS